MIYNDEQIHIKKYTIYSGTLILLENWPRDDLIISLSI